MAGIRNNNINGDSCWTIGLSWTLDSGDPMGWQLKSALRSVDFFSVMDKLNMVPTLEWLFRNVLKNNAIKMKLENGK